MVPAFLGRRPEPSGGVLIPALDALRGVAVLSVFVQHLGDAHMAFVGERASAALPPSIAPWLMTVLHHAHWGVDLFFVLSGFSLAQPILARAARAAEAREPRDELAFSAWGRAFFRRRAARIYPAYLVALALVIVSVPAIARSPSFPASLAAHLALLQGYVTPGGLAIIGAAWSLTTEATFYIAWPLLAPRILASPVRPPVPSRVRGRHNPWLTGTVLVIVVWLLRGALHEIALLPAAPAWLLEASQRRWAVSRLDQFVLGGLAASLHARAARSRLAPQLARIAPALVVASALSLVPAFYLEGTFYPEPLGSWPYALVSLSTAALVLASALAGERASRWLFPGPLRAVGVISYGVFLHHQLALGATARLSGSAGTWRALALHASLALGLSALLGWLSWVLVERPVIERAARRR